MKKIVLFAVLLIMTSLSVFASNDAPPQFPGGNDAMIQYLNKELKYPADAQKEGVEGKVTVQFYIAVDGSVEDVKVIRSVHPSLDTEAVRVVSAMPKWSPGIKEGKPVRVRYLIPLSFSL